MISLLATSIRSLLVVRRWSRGGLATILAIGLASAGCQRAKSELAHVEGIVTLDGTPVSNVMVEFQPDGVGSPSVGYTNRAGEYRLRFSRTRWGAFPGVHVVRIDYDPAPGSRRPPARIPARYNTSTEIRRELRAGHNHLTFDLCSCGSPYAAETANASR